MRLPRVYHDNRQARCIHAMRQQALKATGRLHQYPRDIQRFKPFQQGTDTRVVVSKRLARLFIIQRHFQRRFGNVYANKKRVLRSLCHNPAL